MTECKGWSESDLEHAAHMDADQMVGRLTCDFCGTQTENVYKHVNLCPRCGLVQSEPRSDRTISTSCEADQGNLRNGKGFRFPLSLPILESLDWSQIHTALDIGSNRGTFLRWMHHNHEHVTVTAVEPEMRLVNYGTQNVYIGKFEDLAWYFKPVDFVFSSHTLEHSLSADGMMKSTERLMPIGSHMLLEIPNLATIKDQRVVEEFFIYKHNWHFSTPQLIPYLMDLGFEIERDASTRFDIRFLLRKVREPIQFRGFSFAVEVAREWFALYERNIERNRAALPKIVAELHDLAKNKCVAYWGAGRIFDALVRYGGLDTSDVHCLVDGMLYGVVPDVHGIKLEPPSVLEACSADVIVVLGRTSSNVLVTEAVKYTSSVLTFDHLLDKALA